MAKLRKNGTPTIGRDVWLGVAEAHREMADELRWLAGCSLEALEHILSGRPGLPDLGDGAPKRAAHARIKAEVAHAVSDPIGEARRVVETLAILARRHDESARSCARLAVAVQRGRPRREAGPLEGLQAEADARRAAPASGPRRDREVFDVVERERGARAVGGRRPTVVETIHAMELEYRGSRGRVAASEKFQGWRAAYYRGKRPPR